MELLLSILIISFLWGVVYFFEWKKQKDLKKKDYPSARKERRQVSSLGMDLDEWEEEIS